MSLKSDTWHESGEKPVIYVKRSDSKIAALAYLDLCQANLHFFYSSVFLKIKFS